LRVYPKNLLSGQPLSISWKNPQVVSPRKTISLMVKYE